MRATDADISACAGVIYITSVPSAEVPIRACYHLGRSNDMFWVIYFTFKIALIPFTLIEFYSKFTSVRSDHSRYGLEES